MAPINSIFSRLFRANKHEGKTSDSPHEEHDHSAPAQQSSPLPEPKKEQFPLQLPQNHAIYELRDLRSNESSRLPPPAILLEVVPDVLSPDEAKRELSRLQVFVSSTSSKRLAKMHSKDKKKKADGNKQSPPVEEIAEIPNWDAQVCVFTTSGAMTAWLLIYPPSGKGQELTSDMIKHALESEKINYGINDDLLNRLPELPDRYLHLFLIAQGKKAVPGKDGVVIDLFPRDHEKKVTIDEHNRVDFTSLNLVQNVDKGQAICNFVFPTQGEPGMTVQGKQIPARDGLKATPPKGNNTELNEDGSSLIASRTGHVDFNGRTFNVQPVLDIGGNVDFSTGNINFLGDVHVRGDVCAGFSIRAQGSITVDGVVEACNLRAGGDIILAGGVQGDNQAVVRSYRNIIAKFLENSSVYAREGIQAECIVNCDVYSNGLIGITSGWGTITGGKIRAAQKIEANVIGSKSENITNVLLGGLPCELFDQQRLTRDLMNLENEIDSTERQPDSPTKFSSLSKMRMKVSINRDKLKKLRKELEDQEALSAEQKQKGLRLTCGIVYPGTIITMDEVTMRLNHEIKPCTATLVDGEICMM